MTDDQIHWFSIINSLMIVLFLTGMVAMIMMRTLRRDISQYNELESAEEAQEETGWKLVRAPRKQQVSYLARRKTWDLPSALAILWYRRCTATCFAHPTPRLCSPCTWARVCRSSACPSSP